MAQKMNRTGKRFAKSPATVRRHSAKTNARLMGPEDEFYCDVLSTGSAWGIIWLTENGRWTVYERRLHELNNLDD